MRAQPGVAFGGKLHLCCQLLGYVGLMMQRLSGRRVGTQWGRRCCWCRWNPVPGCTDSAGASYPNGYVIRLSIDSCVFFGCIKATTFNAVIAASVLSLFWWCTSCKINRVWAKSPEERSSQWLPALRLLTAMPIRWFVCELPPLLFGSFNF